MSTIDEVAAHRERLLAAFRGPEWEAVAVEYGAIGATRADELRAALDAVARWARARAAAAGEPASGELLARLDRLADDALAEVSAGPRAGLAAIFANATASAGWWAARSSGGPVEVARCPGCGAAQQRVLCFTCQYCGGELYPQAQAQVSAGATP